MTRIQKMFLLFIMVSYLISAVLLVKDGAKDISESIENVYFECKNDTIIIKQKGDYTISNDKFIATLKNGDRMIFDIRDKR